MTAGVYESERGQRLVGVGSRLGGDRLFPYRLADNREPLFPFLGFLWLVVGVQQQSPAEWTASALSPEQVQRVAA